MPDALAEALLTQAEMMFASWLIFAIVRRRGHSHVRGSVA